jgi:hypothetical protein
VLPPGQVVNGRRAGTVAAGTRRSVTSSTCISNSAFFNFFFFSTRLAHLAFSYLRVALALPTSVQALSWSATILPSCRTFALKLGDGLVDFVA